MAPKMQPLFLSVLAMTFWNIQFGVGDPTTNVYDRTCFVSPSPEGTSNENRLMQFNASTSFRAGDTLPPGFTLFPDYSAFPVGTCGVELYFYTPYIYFDPGFGSTIDIEANIALVESCHRKEENNLKVSSHPWDIKVLTTGRVPNTGVSYKRVPDEELTRVPAHWLDGLVIRANTDYIVAPGQVNLCNVSFFHPVPGSMYNFNFTVWINGCPAGKYGSRCELECSCIEGVECHSFNGVCMCPQGLQGTQCDQRDPQLVVDQEQIYIPYKSSSTLTCTTHGMSPTQVFWTKDGDQDDLLVTDSQVKMVSYVPRPVLATTTVYAHNTSVNGGYTCEARDATGTVYKQQVYVTVIALPDPFVQSPQNCRTLTYSNITFTCETKRDSGVTKWIRGRSGNLSAEISDGEGRYMIRQPSEGVSQLHIIGVEFEDEDVYRCYVGYIFRAPDLSFAEASLVVNSAPHPECSFQAVIDIQSSSTLTLHCSVRGAKPIPSLTWSIQDRAQPVTTDELVTPSNDGWSWNVTSFMTIVPTPEDDGKEIIFTMQTPALTDGLRAMAILNVTYAPIVTISPDPITVIAGEDIKIRCKAVANPPPLFYSWTLCRRNKTHFRHTKDNNQLYVFRNVGKEYDKASLTCRVANAVGETQLTVSIKVVDGSVSKGVVVTFSVLGGLCLVLLVVGSVLAHCYRKEIKILWAKRAIGKYNAGKEYDVFISHKSNSPEERFVIRELVPRLEQDGYKVCVHYKSFLPGRSIIDNIAEAVHVSRKTILLLSPGFIESEWCRYEFQAALSEMLHLKADLIPIVFQDLGPIEKLSQDLQSILQTVSYITWPGDNEHNQVEQERFWKLLWNSLPKRPLGQKESCVEWEPGKECVGSVSLEVSGGNAADGGNNYHM